jgi:hypothetical protein
MLLRALSLNNDSVGAFCKELKQRGIVRQSKTGNRTSVYSFL